MYKYIEHTGPLSRRKNVHWGVLSTPREQRIKSLYIKHLVLLPQLDVHPTWIQNS